MGAAVPVRSVGSFGGGGAPPPPAPSSPTKAAGASAAAKKAGDARQQEKEKLQREVEELRKREIEAKSTLDETRALWGQLQVRVVLYTFSIYVAFLSSLCVLYSVSGRLRASWSGLIVTSLHLSVCSAPRRAAR